MDVYGYHQDQLHAFPSLIAVVKHFTTIFSRTDFYPSSVKERIFARNCLLSLSLSSFSLPDNFVEDTRWIIHIPSMEIWMSRRGDSFTTRNSKGHGIYRDSSTIVKLSFGLKGEEKRMFARHTRYANVRNVKKRFFDFFLPSFFFRESSEEKRVFNNAGNRFRFESFVRRTRWNGRGRLPPSFFSIRFSHRTMLVPLGRK